VDAVGRSREFRLGSKHVGVVGAFAGRAQATDVLAPELCAPR
jgi:hypothetical protein